MAKRYAGSTAERVFDIKLAVAAERERCAKIADEWLSGPTMLLRAGEMTLQEKRTALAIVASIAVAIRNHKSEEK